MFSHPKRYLLLVFLLAPCVFTGIARAGGTLTGEAYFDRIAGNPAMGRKTLYEWDLFLSPSLDSDYAGPSRRLGAPPDQAPTGDGFYRIEDIPPGAYSVYVNQPDFFASPAVVPEVFVQDDQTMNLDIQLGVDYSTYFADNNEWTDWQWDWYQTFSAVGTSVRGVSWMMAGWGLYKDKQAAVTLYEDNGSSDIRNWTPLGSAIDGTLASDSDEWVRWISGEIPLTPGKQYAVGIHIDGGMAIYKRDKDQESYQGGQAYGPDGNPRDFDLNITVFTDRDTMVTHTTRSPGPGHFDGALSETCWGQTFVATGTALAAADLFAAAAFDDITMDWVIRREGPGGDIIGGSKTTKGAYFASSTKLFGVSYGRGEIPLVPGETYFIEIRGSAAFTPYVRDLWEAESDGCAYRNGYATENDLSLTIVEYRPVPEPHAAVFITLLIATAFTWRRFQR